jgi:hypothetical protein
VVGEPSIDVMMAVNDVGLGAGILEVLSTRGMLTTAAVVAALSDAVMRPF